MPNLSIKDVPEEIAEALRQRAASNHRSLQGELMAIISAAVAPSVPLPAADVRPATQSWRQGTRTIEELIEERRRKYPEPVRSGPLGVDIIREDRDNR
jgi:plasmid stability protein